MANPSFMDDNKVQQQRPAVKWRRLGPKFLGWSFVLCLCILITWSIGPTLWDLVRDRAALEAFMAQLGWLGPVMLIALNILQIIVAPIPGYAVQVVSGVLYGAFWGGVWGNVGLMLGAMLAMWLSRRFGRPLVERLISRSRLDKWEALTTSTGTVLWFILIFGPTGDIPYYLAGLSTVSYTKIALLVLTIRVPTTFAITAASAGAFNLAWWQVTAVILILSALFILFMRYQEPLQAWIDHKIQKHLES